MATQAYNKAYREAHKKELKAYAKIYRQTHKQEIEAYKHAHKEELVVYQNAYNKKYRETHLEEIRIRDRERYRLHKNEMNESSKLSHRKNKKIVFDHYGNICICCKETRTEFLTIDHINGEGAKHRKKVGAGSRFYRWLINNDFPEGFQTLCMNCNFSRGKFGYCPHEREKNARVNES